MIDWWFVASNAVWILGAAIVAWTWSFNRWRSISGSGSGHDVSLWLGLLLVCTGQTLVGGRWWEIVGWIALGIWSAAHIRPSVSFAG